MEVIAIARNLLRGTKEGVWRTEVPQWGPGRQPRWESGGKAPRSWRHAEYSTEQSHRSSQIAYCSKSDYTLKISSYDGGEHAQGGLGYATDYVIPKKATAIAETSTIISKVVRLFFDEFLHF